MYSVFSFTLPLNRSQWFLPTRLLNFGSTADKLELDGMGGINIPFIDFFELKERGLKGHGSPQFSPRLSRSCLSPVPLCPTVIHGLTRHSTVLHSTVYSLSITELHPLVS